MAGVRVDTRIVVDNRASILREVSQASKQAMTDVTNDIAKASSGATPHKTGKLEDSYSTEVGYDSAYKLFGEVSYSVVAQNGYNYAVKMHEEQYNLGTGSRNKPGGRGMSGNTYAVGNHFLTRVLEGEKATYTRHIDNSIKNALR
jgi:hypothetical protein